MPLAPFNAYTNRFAPLQDALQSLIQSNDQSNAQDEQRKQRMLAIYAQNPALASKLQQANPDQFAGVNIPTYQPTAEEQNGVRQQAIWQHILEAADQAQREGRPYTPDPILLAIANDKYGGQQPLMTDASGRYTYTHPNDLPQNVTDAQKVKDKLSEDADAFAKRKQEGDQFQQTYTGVTLPQSQATIGHLSAQTAFEAGPHTAAENARAGQENASARKATAETAGINAANSALSGGTPAAPGQSATVAGPPDPTAPVGGGASPLVMAMVARRADPAILTAIARRNPAIAQALEAQAQTLDPQFNWAEYPKQVANLKEYSQAGQTGKNVTSINTAVKHLNAYLDDLGQMNNMNFGGQYGNAVINGVGSLLGNEGIQQHGQTVEKEAEAVATELNKSFRGSSQLSEKDTAQWRQGLSQNTTPAQGLGAASAAVRLLASRIQEIANSYKRDTGLNPPDFLASVRPILQKFKKLGVEGVDDLMGNSGTAPTAPSAGGGSGGKQLDSATAGAFLKMAGGDKDKARQLATAAGYSF